MEWIWIAAAIVVLLIVVIRNIRVVQQSQAYVIERLGAFSAVWGVGTDMEFLPEESGQNMEITVTTNGGNRNG